MKKMMIVALALLVAGASLSTAQAGKKDKKVKSAVVAKPVPLLQTASDSLSYTAGYVLAEIVNRYLGGLAGEVKGTADSLQMKMAQKGLVDALAGDTAYFKAAAAEDFLNNRVMAVRKMKEEKAKEAGKLFLEENAKKDGVVVLPSGLQYKVLTAGFGPVPKATDRVQVKYEGRLIDGTVFDSTEKHGGQPATFAPNQVIKGWTEALTMMPVGSKWQLYIPQELGYGTRAQGPIPAYSTLIFDVEVVGIEEPKK